MTFAEFFAANGFGEGDNNTNNNNQKAAAKDSAESKPKEAAKPPAAPKAEVVSERWSLFVHLILQLSCV